MMSEKSQRAICILGMHRSGTSVIARAINLLGAYLGKEEDLMPPHFTNQKGFWERNDIVEVHDRVLSHFGGTWYSFTPLPKQWYESEDIKHFREELIELIRKNFSEHSLWAWKDPRTCLLLPLWIDVLKELGVELSCVYVVRNPLDVAKSHRIRDGFPYEKSFGLWFYYNMEALQASHALPRYFISYDGFLSNWELELRRCVAGLKIPWPEDESIMRGEMNEFISPDLRHSFSKLHHLEDAGIPSSVLKLNQLFEKAVETSSITETTFIEDIERLYEEFSFYANFLLYDTNHLWDMGRQLNYKDLQLNSNNSYISKLEATIHAQQQELDRVHASLKIKLLETFRQAKNRILQSYIRRSFHLILRFVRLFLLYHKLVKVIINEGRSGFINEFRLRKYKKGTSNDPTYNSWISKNEPDKSQLRAMRAGAQTLLYRPKVSIITPVYNPNEYDLTECLTSVLCQIYQEWELCLVDGGGDKPHVKDVIKRFMDQDSRIKYIALSENRGIDKNSNEALKLATGEYVAFLDHYNMLAPYALYEVVNLLNQNPSLDFIYSDEDKVLPHNEKRYEPNFKPDWSPDTFLSYNYIGDFVVVRKSIIDEIGGFRSEYDGVEDYDLILRVIDKTDKIYHIPKILYNCKVASNLSTASCTNPQMDVFIKGKKTIKEYLSKKGLEADVLDGIFTGSYRIKYKIRQPWKVCIIIPTKDKAHLLKKCVSSIIERTDYKDYEILIIDNQSTEQETYKYLDSLKNESKVRIIQYDKPFNYSAINNFAVESTDAEYVLFLNNDTEVINNEWLSAMLEFAQREDVGAVGAKLLYPDETIQHAGILIGMKQGIADHSHRHFPHSSNGYFGRINSIQNFSAVTAACMMMRREVFEGVGGFTEIITVAFNDVDLCLKIREKGYLIVYTPYAELYHYESASRGLEDTPEKLARANQEKEFMKTRWKHILDAGDPYYNPNLSLSNTDFSIKV